MIYSKEEWINIIHEKNIIERLNCGETLNAIAKELMCSSSRLGKVIREDLGYIKDEKQGIYYLENDINKIKFLNSIDIEDTTDEIARKRYYTSYLEPYWESERNNISINIDEEIYKEYIELAQKYGCDFDNEFLTMVLLEGLNKYYHKDNTREFALKYINENEEYSNKKKKFILQKEKEGYDLESLIYLDEDLDLLEISSKELEEKCNKNKI